MPSYTLQTSDGTRARCTSLIFESLQEEVVGGSAIGDNEFG